MTTKSVSPDFRTMSKGEFNLALEQLGLDETTAGAYLGFSLRTGQRYSTGELPVPQTTAALIRLMLHRPRMSIKEFAKLNAA